MEITFDAGYSGYYINVEAENVRISEDVESRIYHKTEDGKTDFTKAPIRDVSTEHIDKIATLLSDMIYYREADYDSSGLIRFLFDKMPSELASELSKELFNTFGEEEKI